MLAPLTGSSFSTAVGRLWLGLHKGSDIGNTRGGIVKQIPYAPPVEAAACPQIDPETCVAFRSGFSSPAEGIAMIARA